MRLFSRFRSTSQLLLPRPKLLRTTATLSSLALGTYVLYTNHTELESITGVSLPFLPTTHLLGFGRRSRNNSKLEDCILALDLQHPFADFVQPSLLRPTPSAKDVIDCIERASHDTRVHGIIANVSQRSGWTLAQVQEISEAIHKFRATGKVAIAYADSFGQVGSGLSNYVLACAFDRVVCQESSDMPIASMWLEQTFVRGLLDKLEIRPQIFQRKEYKNAANQIMSTHLTAEHRDNVYGLASGLYEQICLTIAQARNKSLDEVKAIIRDGCYDADTAMKYGLIDRIMYEHQLPDYCKKLALAAQHAQKQEVEQLVKADVAESTPPEQQQQVLQQRLTLEQIDVELRKSIGLESHVEKLEQLKTYRFSTYLQEYKVEKLQKDKIQKAVAPSKIALIYAAGPVTNVGQQGPFKSLAGSFHSITLAKAITSAALDDKVKVIVLRVDTPGGSVVASDTVYQAIHDARKLHNKKVVCSYGNISASGGVFSTCCADMLIANPGTITGSIGVFGGKVAIGDFVKNKLFVNVEPIAVGGSDNGSAGSLFFPYTPEQAVVVNKLIDKMYDDFVGKVSKGRDLSFDYVEKRARGRVYTGEQALSWGLIDSIGSLHYAIDRARQYLPEEERDLAFVEVVPKKLSFIELIQRAIYPSREDAEKDQDPLFNEMGPQSQQDIASMFNELMTVTHTTYQAMTAMQLPQMVNKLVHGTQVNESLVEMKAPAQYYQLNGLVKSESVG